MSKQRYFSARSWTLVRLPTTATAALLVGKRCRIAMVGDVQGVPLFLEDALQFLGYGWQDLLIVQENQQSLLGDFPDLEFVWFVGNSLQVALPLSVKLLTTPDLLPWSNCPEVSIAEEEVLYAIDRGTPYAFSRIGLQELLQTRGPHWAIQDAEGKRLGFLLTTVVLQEVEVLRLVVCKADQGKGWGSALLRHLVGWSLRSGMEAIWLEVAEANHKARSLYAKFGFQEQYKRLHYYRVEESTDHALVLCRPMYEQ